MTFSTHPKVGANEESSIRSLFAGIGATPHVDYTYNGGRSRFLDFPVADDIDNILALCERVFREVYGIQVNDTLKYSYLLPGDFDRLFEQPQ